MILPVTLTIAAASALLALWLAIRVGRVRMAAKVMIGDGDNPLLLARMRAHANFVEYTPIILVLMALIELAGGSANALWGAGIAYVVARILHPYGMERPAPNPLRMIGIVLTMLVLIALAAWALAIPYLAMGRA